MAGNQHKAPEEEYTEISGKTVPALKGFDEKAAEALAPIFGRFMKAYEESEPDEESRWLNAPLQEELPERPAEDIAVMRQEIRESVAA